MLATYKLANMLKYVIMLNHASDMLKQVNNSKSCSQNAEMC